ncbi:amidohydrolase [Sphingopyxis sp. H038]|uniref:amidohydrolase family protein n=1 Tax=unclassified Sphingopyxis TaxID=2614943 RepID=UPI0007309204|nr:MULTISPECIES: amidohydrolase family protein [unclassified Sphingopyxis]KTE04427.1 amidohydrolase [Sphingopyxis sp. H012]KTE08149.1 amidohydrolase [Sphingopyxis sp. H093]KTE13372.1 amidohydrolase [Sphingopyxis sp. H053]KTE31211.1 amidohydrolase [Sphingopyxis sp. H080]KTE36917.1 amidohydrolase [Sphingopyxis sp. H038]
MLRALLTLWLLLACATLARAETVVFTDVNVVPMDRERVIARTTVIVTDGVISSIGIKAKLPADTPVVDGKGAWLVPGLADMHNHVTSRDDLALLLANGVTTMLNMGEATNAFAGRTRIAVNKGEVPGPQIFTAFVIDSDPQYGHFVVRTADEARAIVRLAKTNGYSFIKVYTNLSAEAFAALADEAKAQGVGIVGHNVKAVGLAKQLAAGQAMIAHVEEFFYGFFAEPPADDPNAPPADARIADAIALAKAHDAFVTSDLFNYRTIAAQFGKPEVVKAYLAAPEARYLSPADRLAWAGSGYQKKAVDLSRRVAFEARFVKAMADAGVPLIAGGDAPTIPGQVPGFALHGEIDAMLAAGLTPWQALSAATRTPGEFVAKTVPGAERFGVVAPGYRADLLLVAENPFERPATLRAPLGVMAGGRWHDAAALKTMLAEVAAKRVVP